MLIGTILMNCLLPGPWCSPSYDMLTMMMMTMMLMMMFTIITTNTTTLRVFA